MVIYDYECVNPECREENEASYYFEASCPGIAMRDEFMPDCPKCGAKCSRVFNKKGPMRHVSWSQWNDHNKVG